ncbi:MAG: hypothetical protein WCG67_00470 [Ferruginibacter sp.]
MKEYKIKPPTKMELDEMTEDQKRLIFIQLQQQETMVWQRQAAGIQVYTFWIGLLVTIGWFIFQSNK